MRIVQHQKKVWYHGKESHVQGSRCPERAVRLCPQREREDGSRSPFKTYEDAAAALNRRYRMLVGVKDPDMKPEKLVGTPEDFAVSVNKGNRATFTDHYFIEEV